MSNEEARQIVEDGLAQRKIQRQQREAELENQERLLRVTINDNHLVKTITEAQKQEQKLEEMYRLLDEKKLKALQEHLEASDAFDVAQFLSELPEQQMIKVFRVLSKEHGADVFAELDF